MQPTEQTLSQIERALHKVIQKFPSIEEPEVITDIHLRVLQDSGEIRAYDDEDQEITRCVIEQWIENKDDGFYDDVAEVLRSIIKNNQDAIDKMGILKPFSFVLENEEMEHLVELYVSDDDIAIIGGDLMSGLEDDLNNFLQDLLD